MCCRVDLARGISLAKEFFFGRIFAVILEKFLGGFVRGVRFYGCVDGVGMGKICKNI